LINYALDFLEQKSYKLMYTPHFMKHEKISQVCQLSEFEETLYKIQDSDLYLIATSEQPMTAYFADKQVSNLPIKMCGISTCYRKEAGRHGDDTLGIFRVHQFEKVEQFCITAPDKSWEMMEEMDKTAQEFFESLGLSYRVVNIVSSALNNAASMKYDIEGLFKGTGLYRELVSCSNTTDFFSRKIKTKCGPNEFAHLLNSTLCANTRTLCCLLETYQVEDGVIIPEVLKKYYNKDKILFKN
jgi:seryl-tRNA synthetase